MADRTAAPTSQRNHDGRRRRPGATWVALHALDLSGLRTGSTAVVIGCGAYAKAVRDALPDAVLVADRFHLVALANDMLTQVRRRVLRESQGRRGRKTDPAWAARRRLLTDTSGYGTKPLQRCGTH